MGFVRDLWHAGGTGGLNWHVHAFYTRTQWQATVAQLEDFLNHVTPGSAHLLLIGASAGWMMPPSWLQRFKRIDAYDIDPLAARLFDWRHGKTLRTQSITLQHHREDALLNLRDVLQRHPQACVWFDNVLGQHRYRVRDEVRAEQDLAALKDTLQGRHWGSVHDLYSGPTQDNRPWMSRIASLTRAGVDNSHIDSQHTQALLREVGAQEVWVDHLTAQVFPSGTPTTLMPWAFKDQYCHWLQAGWVTP
jgi:hypothetical protein